MRARTGATAIWVVLLTALGGCSGGGPAPDAAPGRPAQPPTAGIDPASPPPQQTAVPRRLRAAVSAPHADTVYPALGDPRIDALHYDLELTWAPASRRLSGRETVELRATGDTGRIQLDLSSALTVSSATVDGRPARFDQAGSLLAVDARWHADRLHTLVLRYAGTPEPIRGPSRRGDLSSIGLNITPDGQLWTMQEPFGAFTWYAVNDVPSDKAFYDFRLRVPSPMVGVANGRLVSRTGSGPDTVSRWHLDQPAASYLVTVAFGALTRTDAGSVAGTPVSYWTQVGDARTLRRVRHATEALAWVERKLGPYPFDTLGVLVPAGFTSGMETQTMLTLAASPYATSRAVLVHEIVHQWYGDLVTPADWRDLWMNEGMAMYLQEVWVAERTGRSIESVLDRVVATAADARREEGPPGAYDRNQFAGGTVYYGPALMWDELRKRLGEPTFWRLVRDWPHVHAFGNATRSDYVVWINQQTGRDLTSFFQAWLMDPTSPPRT